MSQRFNSVSRMFAELESEFLLLHAERDELRAKIAAFENEAKELEEIHQGQLRAVVRREHERLDGLLRRLFKDEYAAVLSQQLKLEVSHFSRG